MKGACVGVIQKKLNEVNSAGLAPDEKFWKLTEGGVTNFQTKNNISPANGIVDQKTLTLLLSSGSTDDLSTTDANKFN
jgi:peptidoglycan hydrolase-like protein with peptidoglycan-binding domain